MQGAIQVLGFTFTFTFTVQCAPVWHYALTKILYEPREEAVRKRAIHIVHIA